MNPDIKSKINTAQLNVLVARLKAGKPLTDSQMKFVEAQFPPAFADGAPVEHDDEIAANANDLANRLGIHRQVIAYHKGRDGAPADFSVQRWREYLVVMGKMQTGIKLGKTGEPARAGFNCDTAFAVMFHDLSEALPTALRASLNNAGVKVSPHRVDAVTWGVWILLVAVYQRLAKSQGVDGPFSTVNEFGKYEYPDEIMKLATRMAITLPKNPAPPVTTQAAEQSPTESQVTSAPPSPTV